MPDNLQLAAADAPFASTKDAEDFLARALPRATAGNPRYRSPNDATETAWVTKSVKFGPGGDDARGRRVSMSEEVLEFRNGARSNTGSHEVSFLLGDVKIAERTDSGDVTQDGAAALGIIFNCNSGKCIQSVSDGKQSQTEWADIYIQDSLLRDKILKAFERIQRTTGEP